MKLLNLRYLFPFLVGLLLVLAVVVSRRENYLPVEPEIQVAVQEATPEFSIDCLSPSEAAPDWPFKPSSARDQICLNGEWDFQPTMIDLPMPLPDKWEQEKVRVPIPWNVNGFSEGPGGDFRCNPSYPEHWDRIRAGWLRRTFHCPKGMPTDRWSVRFNAAAHRVVVYLNGEKVGENDDGFMPFEVSINHALKQNEDNELLVGCAGWEALAKDGRREAPCGSFWGLHVVGIWQDVYLIRRPETFLRNIFVRTRFEPPSITVHASIDSSFPDDRQLRILHEILTWIPGQRMQDWINQFFARYNV